MSRPPVADDFATIRARMDELRREREPDPDTPPGKLHSERREAAAERRRRERIEGLPPPWVPTIFIKQPCP